MHEHNTFRPVIGFLLLFGWYHGAEYQILYSNNSIGFLCCSAAFLLTAYVLARLQMGRGMDAWYLRPASPAQGITGLFAGIAIYTIAFLVQLAAGIQHIAGMNTTPAAVNTAVIMAAGTLISSATEDLLTRSYIIRHLAGKVAPAIQILAAATVYTFNHIYRLNEPVYLLFLFLTGIQLAIPLVQLRNIGYTIGMHWAGNIVYHLTSNLLLIHEGPSASAGLWVAMPFLVLLAPLNYMLCKRYQRSTQEGTMALVAH